MARVLTGPEKSSASSVESLDDGFVDPNGRHKVEGKGTKDSRRKNEASRPVEKRSSPARKVAVARRDNGKTICNREFMRGEREAKVSLGESRDASSKGVSKDQRQPRWRDRQEGRWFCDN